MKKINSLKTRIVLYFFLTALLPLILLTSINSVLGRKMMSQNSLDHLKTLQKTQIQHITKYFNEAISSINYITQSEIINKNLPYFKNQDIPDSNEKELLTTLNYFMNKYFISDIYILDNKEPKILFSVQGDYNEGHTIKSQNGLMTTWNKVKGSNEICFTDFSTYQYRLKNKINKNFSAFLGFPIFLKNSKSQLDGILIIRIEEQSFNQLINVENLLGESGISYLIAQNSEGDLSLRTDLSQLGYSLGQTLKPAPLYWKEAFLNFGGGSGRYIDIQNKRAFVVYNQIYFRNIHYSIITKQDESEILAPLLKLTDVSLQITIILSLFGAIIAYLFSLSITNPITKSSHIAWNISNQNFQSNINFANRNDEIGILGQALENMSSELQEIHWENRAKNLFENKTRGDFSVEELSNRILDFFRIEMNALTGAFYLGDKKIIHLISSFGLSTDAKNRKTLQGDEGLIGSTIKNKEILCFFNKTHKDSQLNKLAYIDLGIKTLELDCFLLAPLQIQKNYFGLILLNSNQPFKDDKINFMTGLKSNIEILLRIASSRDKIKNLYLESKEQQKELISLNKELEEQTLNLKVSEEKLLSKQSELKIINKDLQRSNQYKRDFLSNVSHELRTPLNSIIILSDILSKNKSANLTKKQLESSVAIYQSGQDLLKLIDDILNLSKVEAGKLDIIIEKVKTEEFVKKLFTTFNPLAKNKKIEFKIINTIPKEEIETDPFRLEQILKNLLFNALKFTKPNGVVTLSLQKDQKDNTHPIVISVSDTGIGIEESQQEKIFHSFEQESSSISREYGGTGLGLAISQRISTLLEGTLSLKSQKNIGSSFSIRLPLKHSLSQKSSKLPPPPNMPILEEKLLQDKQILLIDENIKSLFSFSHILELYGSTISKATNIEKALALLSEDLNNYDLIISNKVSSSKKWYKDIKKLNIKIDTFSIPILALSPLENREEQLETIKSGAKKWLVKDIESLDFICKISQLIDKQTVK